MTVITPPLFLNVNSTYGADELGLPYRDLITEGVVGSTDLAVSQRSAGANMSVDVAAGVAWVKGDSSAAQPCYRCYNDGTVNLTISTADATNPRVDIVIAEVLDSTFSGASNLWRLRVVTGTPAASPSTPSTPSNAIKLAEISVPAADTTISTAQITDTRPRARVKNGGQPGVLATRGTSYASLTTGAWVAVPWDAESFDTDGMHSTSSNTERITITESGIYAVHAVVNIQEVNTTGERHMGIGKNGATSPDVVATSCPPVSAAGVTRMNVATIVELSAGDYLRVFVFQSSGASRTMYADGAGFPARFGAHKVGSSYWG